MGLIMIFVMIFEIDYRHVLFLLYQAYGSMILASIGAPTVTSQVTQASACSSHSLKHAGHPTGRSPHGWALSPYSQHKPQGAS